MRGWKKLSLMASVLTALSLGLASVSYSYVNYGPIKAGDSLWHIAETHRSLAHTSTRKMVRAIQALNPSVKKLHVGSMLKIPSSVAELQLALGGQPSAEVSPVSSVSPVSPEKKSPSLLASELADQALFLKKSVPNHSVPGVAVTSAVASGAPSQTTTQLVSPAVLASQVQTSVAATPLQVSQTVPAQSSASGDSSFWAWVWFAGLLVALAFGWRNRSRLFARLHGGKEIAARRLGLHRAEHEQAFDTSILWTKEKPSYSAEHAFKEGDSMAQAMIQMAEGEYLEAKKTLIEAIARDPKNIDLRMKLLENCVALDDREYFKQESDDLLENLMDEADPRWGKIKNMYLRKWAYDTV